MKWYIFKDRAEPAQPTNPKEMTVLYQLPSANLTLSFSHHAIVYQRKISMKRTTKLRHVYCLQKVGSMKVFDVRRILFHEPFFASFRKKKTIAPSARVALPFIFTYFHVIRDKRVAN